MWGPGTRIWNLGIRYFEEHSREEGIRNMPGRYWNSGIEGRNEGAQVGGKGGGNERI